jgi:hypothetical protein
LDKREKVSDRSALYFLKREGRKFRLCNSTTETTKKCGCPSEERGKAENFKMKNSDLKNANIFLLYF